MLKRTRTTNSEAIVNELELSKQLVDYSLIEGTILRQKYANYFQNFDEKTSENKEYMVTVVSRYYPLEGKRRIKVCANNKKEAV